MDNGSAIIEAEAPQPAAVEQPAPALPPLADLPPDPHLVIKPSSGWAAMNLREVWQFRDLLFTLAGRDLKLRYKQTALGIIWVIVQPLMAAGVFTVVFGMVANLSSDGVPYFLFSFVGQLGWNLFANIVTKSSGCLVGNSQLISKVFFPRLVLPLSTLPSTLVDFAVAAAMLVCLMFSFHWGPNALALLTLPLWMAILIGMSVGIGLVTSALTVSYRDVQYILPVFLQITMYASPVAYGISSIHNPWVKLFYSINPMTPVLEGFRWSLLHTAPPTWPLAAYSATVALVLVLLGAFSFKRMERRFADVV